MKDNVFILYEDCGTELMSGSKFNIETLAETTIIWECDEDRHSGQIETLLTTARRDPKYGDIWVSCPKCCEGTKGDFITHTARYDKMDSRLQYAADTLLPMAVPA